jgi:hypothetical protein
MHVAYLLALRVVPIGHKPKALAPEDAQPHHVRLQPLAGLPLVGKVQQRGQPQR